MAVLPPSALEPLAILPPHISTKCLLQVLLSLVSR